jgi:hypothetical protein
MPNKPPHVSTHDQLRHVRSIKLLAEELNRPVQEIAPIYEDALLHLKEHASIHDYLTILASKRVKLLFTKLH